jgi:hypothetical protein
MVCSPILRPLRPELNGQDPFQICGRLCQTRKTAIFFNKLGTCQLYLRWVRDFWQFVIKKLKTKKVYYKVKFTA